jgi:hypothetical protein
VLLLITRAMPSLLAFDSEHIGRLIQPREYGNLSRLIESGIPWAADNDAFQGFKETPYEAMLTKIAFLPNCLFVTAPDVVANADATGVLFREWEPIIHLAELPVALVGQDGLTNPPWESFEALFIGGSTHWKLGDEARQLVRQAKARGKWVHMGRVNSVRRIRYARAIGCDSVDGSGFARFSDNMVPKAVRELNADPQLAF